MEGPYFELSKSVVLKQYAAAKELGDLVSYSSKTNQEVTKVLEECTDSMFSVHFAKELVHVKDKSRVVFLAQAWNDSEIAGLLSTGIRNFVVDNEPDLDALLAFLDKSDYQVNLFLRVKLRENTLRTERFFVFGMDSSTVNRRIGEIKGRKGVSALGVHFHRKTQNLSEWNLVQEVSGMLTEETLSAITYLNIGGGLPSNYANTNSEVLPSILARVGELRKWLQGKGIKLVVEPGRFIAAPACKLVTSIVGIHENNIIVNASIYNSDLDAVIVPVKLLVEGETSPSEESKPYVVKGITPCSVDLFRYRVYLKAPVVGQKLVFLNAGAYNFTTDFCDLEKIPTRLVD